MANGKGRQWEIKLPNGQKLTGATVYRFREELRSCRTLTDDLCTQILQAILPDERRAIDMTLYECTRISGLDRMELVKVCIIVAWYALRSGTPKEQRGNFDPLFVLERIEKSKGSAQGTLLPKAKRMTHIAVNA